MRVGKTEDLVGICGGLSCPVQASYLKNGTSKAAIEADPINNVN